MEYQSAIVNNEVHDATWMNLKTMPNEKSQTQKFAYCVVPFMLNKQNGQILRESHGYQVVVEVGSKK